MQISYKKTMVIAYRKKHISGNSEKGFKYCYGYNDQIKKE